MDVNYSSGTQSRIDQVRIDHGAAKKSAWTLRAKAEHLRSIAGDVTIFGDVNFGRDAPAWDDELSAIVCKRARTIARHLRDIADSLDETASGIEKTSLLYQQMQGASGAPRCESGNATLGGRP